MAPRSPGSQRLVGLGLAGANIVTGALLPILGRYGALNLDPLLFCAGAAVIATLCVLPLLRLQAQLATLFTPRFILRLMLIALLGTVGPSLTVIYGLKQVTAVTAVLLLQSEPIYSLIVATLLVGEAPSWRQATATLVVLAGISSLFWGHGSLPLSPAALMLVLTPLMWQLSHAVSLGVMPPLSPWALTGARNLYAALVLSVLMIGLHPAALAQLGRPQVLAILLATGVLSYFLGALTWYGAIGRLSLSWTTAVVVPSVPLLSVAFAIAFLDERVTARELIGLGIALTGILGLIFGANPNRPAVTQEILEVLAPPGV